ncbi:radical SAM protein [Desulfobacterales bacterium HSG17]|nr:radical SAM protein [Desulfobacterales bacterium HSG17]
MKILLINPPNSGKSIPEEEYGINNLKMIFRGEPLCLEVLAGNLREHEVVISDQKAAPDSLWTDIETFQPDIAGITGVTCEANWVLKTARQIKDRYRNLKIVAGGHHASCDPEFFNTKSIDYVVPGLGKLSFRELVHAIETGTAANGIPGVAKTNPQSSLSYIPRKYSIEDLVDSKPPRYDLVKQHRDKYVMQGVGGKVGFVATAFGCTHKCSFCSIPNLTGGKYLSHSIDAVLRDMNLLSDIPLIRFVDANTFGNVETAVSLGKKIIESGINKQIVADVRSDTVVKNPELFKLWKQAGLASAVIGFEEVSDARLDQYNKKNQVKTNIKAMKFLKKIGIKVIGDFIVSPDYTYKDFEQLQKFVNSHDIDLPLPSILTPLPGTPIYEKLKHKIVIHDLDYYTFTNAVLPTRIEEKAFYQTYSDLLSTFLAHVQHD